MDTPEIEMLDQISEINGTWVMMRSGAVVAEEMAGAHGIDGIDGIDCIDGIAESLQCENVCAGAQRNFVLFREIDIRMVATTKMPTTPRIPSNAGWIAPSRPFQNRHSCTALNQRE